MNWYTYCNNNPITFVDPLGLDAIVATQSNGAGGAGHMSSFVQDAEGKWYFFFWGGSVSLTAVTDDSILSNTTEMNKWLRSKGLNMDKDPDYDSFSYIPGDFTASLKYYKDLVDDYTYKWGSDYNFDYNLFLRNCSQETMNGLMKGTLNDKKTNVGDYFLSMFQIGTIPNYNMKMIQTAFLNTSYTRAGFNDQVSLNIANVGGILDAFYTQYPSIGSLYIEETNKTITDNMRNILNI